MKIKNILIWILVGCFDFVFFKAALLSCLIMFCYAIKTVLSLFNRKFDKKFLYMSLLYIISAFIIVNIGKELNNKIKEEALIKKNEMIEKNIKDHTYHPYGRYIHIYKSDDKYEIYGILYNFEQVIYKDDKWTLR